MRIPGYRPHSSGAFAFVEFNKVRHRLPGAVESAESRAAYRKFLREHVMVDQPKSLGPSPSVAEIVKLYLDHCVTVYGEGRTELYPQKAACAWLIKTHGDLLASAFKPKKLKEYAYRIANDPLRVVPHMRKYVNGLMRRVKACFGWAVSEELIDESIWHALLSVKPLRRGETLARESKKKVPVKWEWIEAVAPRLSAVVGPMVQVQYLTGVRSGSLTQAKPEQFDTSGEIWLWRPRHKQESMGSELVIAVGPKAQQILAPFMSDKRPEDYLFSPRGVRKNGRYGKCYDSLSYYHSVTDAIKAENKARLEKDKFAKLVPHWSPHQLRHARGHAVRAEYGVEAAQAVLGHANLSATEIYSERLLELAVRVARETG